jgi:hypothetical protein
MTRQIVEDQLFRNRARFRQINSTDYVELGDEPRQSLSCAPKAVYIALDFDMQNPSAASAADVLSSVKLLRQKQGCM